MVERLFYNLALYILRMTLNITTMTTFKMTNPNFKHEFEAVRITKKLANKLLPGYVINADRNRTKIYAIAKQAIYVDYKWQLVIVHRCKFWKDETRWDIIKNLDLWNVEFDEFLTANK